MNNLASFLNSFRAIGIFSYAGRVNSAKIDIVEHKAAEEAWSRRDGDFFILLKAAYQYGVTLPYPLEGRSYEKVKEALDQAVKSGVNQSFRNAVVRSFGMPIFEDNLLECPICAKLIGKKDAKKDSVIDIRVAKPNNPVKAKVKTEDQPKLPLSEGVAEKLQNLKVTPTKESKGPPVKGMCQAFMVMDSYIVGGRVDYAYDGSGRDLKIFIINWTDRASNSGIVGRTVPVTETLYYKYDIALNVLNNKLFHDGLSAVANLKKALTSITDISLVEELEEAIKNASI